MRRSCAPSMLKARTVEKRQKIEQTVQYEDEDENEEVSSTTLLEQNWGTAKRRGQVQGNTVVGTKIHFNAVWREITKKKHKTWDGDGTIEVDVESFRAVLKDGSGKYIGINTKFKVNDLKEGFQMVMGGKEIELLEQITDKNEDFTLRKQISENLWSVEESKQEVAGKIKLSTLYQPPYERNNLTAGNRWPREIKVCQLNEVKDKPALGSVADKIKYNVVWREVSTKKNKTWNGDGIFEVFINSQKGVLKNEMGQELGSIDNVNTALLAPGLQLLISDIEIELLEVITCEIKVTNLPTSPKYINRQSSTAITNSFSLPAPSAKYLSVLNPASRSLVQVTVSHALAQNLRLHQREGVCFLYRCVMGFQDPSYRGCILADEMGLGKTLQCLTLAHTLLRQGPYGGDRVLQRVLIVTPSSLTRQWENEISKWLKSDRMYAFVVGGKHNLASYSRQQHVPFVIVSYESLLAHIEVFQQLKFDMLLCDEGHRLKNQSNKLVGALRELNISRRIIITGTPVQNNMQEFFSLADFVNPGILGTCQEFQRYYQQPLQQSQCPDASEEVKQLAVERKQELMYISERFVLRRLQQINIQYLPKKYEYICFVQPSELQQFLLQKVLQLYSERKETILKEITPLQIITVLKKICNHPSLVVRTKIPNLLTRNLERYLPDWSEMGPFDSAKLEVVQGFLLVTAVQKREKCVLVSNHTKTLNMLQGLCDFLNINCLRLDGSSSNVERNANVEKFNSDSDEFLVFLLSARAGGVGLNLTGASKLILFDNDWNPATDAQAMSRIWRDGQRRDVHIYRLVTAGCIEEKIFQRQVAKISLGDCLIQKVVSNNGDTTKFSTDELLDLFSLQQDYTICKTHESLNCGCAGDGQNQPHCNTVQTGTKINELMSWQHYKSPFVGEFLKAANLHKANNNLFYIFANQTELI